jgi:chorismate mutase
MRRLYQSIKGANTLEHITEEELTASIAELMRSIYKGLIETQTSLDQVTLHKADGTSSLELTMIPLEVWQHIGVDGEQMIETVRASRKDNPSCTL